MICNLIECAECAKNVEYDDAVYKTDDNDIMLCIDCFLKPVN